MFEDLNSKKLTKEQEYKYIRLYQEENDQDAYHKLILSQLAWGIKVGTRVGLTMDKDDITSYAVLGIIHAIKKFDTSKGLRLTTFVTWCVRSYVSRVSAQKYHVYVPTTLVAQKCKEAAQRIQESSRVGMKCLGGVPETRIELIDINDEIEYIFKKISKKSKKFLELYYFRGLTLRQIAKLNGYSVQRAQQIKESILREAYVASKNNNIKATGQLH